MSNEQQNKKTDLHKEFEKRKNMTRRGPGSGHGPGGGMRVGEKPKNMKETLSNLYVYSKKYIPFVILAIICATLSAVLTLIGPNKLSDLTELITQGIMGKIDFNAITKIGVILVAIYAISFILSYIQGYTMASISAKISFKLRKDISEKINKVPMSYFNNNLIGDLLSRVTNDIDTLSHALSQNISSLVTAICLLFGSLFMMIITNVILTVTAILATLIGFILMMVIMKVSQKYFARQQKYLGSINAQIEEVFSGHTVVKAYCAEDELKNTFNQTNVKLQDSAMKAQFLSGLMMPIMTFIGNFGYVAVCIVGGILTLNDKISFSVIVAFILYVRYFTQPLSQIAQGVQNMQSAAAAGERVFEFLHSEQMPDESHKTVELTDVKGDVEFKNVNFGYEGTDKIIINDFSMKAKAGQKIAIVGPTGAGKTTLVNLLMRFNEINSGEITIDGVPISEITRENLHAIFCMVLQDTWIFQGSIKENVRYSKTDATDEDIEKACKAVGLHHFIKTLPHGYDTILDDKASISVGQKQQLTIARAMIENAPMIILDEATSSVDTRTELHIQNAMDKLAQNKTSFVIAHRLSTIKNADIILVLKDGDIVESGSHDELLEKGGFYSELYNSQFETE